MSIAILCSGLDDTLRGYETHQRLLFENLREAIPDQDIYLFKRYGVSQNNEIALHSPKNTSVLFRYLSKITEDPPYWQSFFFSIYFIIYIYFSKLKIKKCLVIEPGVSRTLGKLKKLLNLDVDIIYTHGVASYPEFYFWHSDKKIIEVNIDSYNKAIEYKRLTNSDHEIYLIPHFYEERKVNDKHPLYDFRKRYALQNKKIAICVGVINHSIKRTDYIVNEFSRVSNEWVLLLCGDILDSWIIDEGRMLLGDRLIHMVLHKNDMPYLYSNADLLVFASKNEGFGFSIIEAMCYGLPMLVHENKRNVWITKDADQCIDMEINNSMVDAVKRINNDKDWFNEKGKLNQKNFTKYYTWNSVKKLYVKLFSQ